MRTLSATLLTAALLGTLLVAAPATSTAVPAETCGTELRPADRERIVELGTYDQDSRDLPLVQLRRNVAKLYGIVDILTDRRDRRGLFALGLAAVERDAVMPLQNNPRVFQTPRWAPVISLELLNRFLDAVRGEFGGGPVAPQWRHYFDMADDCAVPGQRVAMAGYNSHITVDLAYATADARATPSNARDFFFIVDAIAAHGNSIVTETLREYGVDLGPIFRFYIVGEGLDRVVGAGRATGPMLRAADVGYNVLTFRNGLALQDVRAAPGARGDVNALWNTGETALTAFQRVGLVR
ncbi:DUF5995 family protein [Gordonia terrae]|uniref:Uncharacterized protein n=2 Tax=Gordonia terrae TaxID=2055 RepID=A0AAD0NXT7_9ACTN|nr:DUF5995 family protein [Gordonia terrae]VTR08802.1 Uncharacterised protein [Clostridioides difficile]ANY21555.1 hypothetical protein BCM27_00790 [Gordonia terrae]AWO82284.1 hypothetical protein DLJ61_00795 [Gordonia terrae]VTS16772.1 Uncharacterised protein [Gordonia terrae]GAB45363.1 hypothetical protein GOTRE_124_00110 [Gordonia terrae NBRC 100016]